MMVKCEACGKETEHWAKLTGEPLRCLHCLMSELCATRQREREVGSKLDRIIELLTPRPWVGGPR